MPDLSATLHNNQAILDQLIADFRCAAENIYRHFLRIDPAFLCSADREEVPFAVFFVHGQGFDGFHVRFQDIARGGIRMVKSIGPGFGCQS